MAGARDTEGPLGARGCGHAWQDDDLVSAGLDSGARGPRSRISDRRRAGQLRHQRAARARRRSSSSRRTSTTRLFSTSARSSSTTGRAPLILNNLEYDHADIYPTWLHPAPVSSPRAHRAGQWPHRLERRRRALARDARHGVLDAVRRLSRALGQDALWTASRSVRCDRLLAFEVLEAGKPRGTVQWSLIGAHNMENALAAIAAARHAGVTVEQAIEALQSFKGVARRMQVRGEVDGIGSMTISRITRPRSRRPWMGCGAASAMLASSRFWSRARIPCAWACIRTRLAASLSEPTRSGSMRPRYRLGCGGRRCSARLARSCEPRYRLACARACAGPPRPAITF